MLLKLKKLKKSYFIITALVIIVALVSVVYYFRDKDNHSENIAIIPIVGQLYSSTQYNVDGSINKDAVASIDIVAQIRKANENREIKAIVFMIDSGGGEVFTAQEITKAIKEIKKPTVSLIRTKGMSSAYWIASATGRIFALSTSATGDIGVTNSFTDNSKQNETNGITFHQLSYGKYKDMYNSDKELTPDEEKLAMEDIAKQADIFINEVAENRNLPVEKVKALADGSIILGQDAIKDGLIDEIGSFAEVDRYLSQTLKKNIHVDILGNNKEHED